MTFEQRSAIADHVAFNPPRIIRHGDCVGADEQFHAIVHAIMRGNCKYHIYPPKDPKYRAGCLGDYYHEPMDYLDRDTVIARECGVLIAAPKGFREEVRSGTWATIRRGIKFGKRVYIFWPDGTISDNYGAS